jgi:catechol 2,3-dioxygenase-like lactoylglutathione lyase family enzyme
MGEPLFTGLNHFCIVTSDLDRAVATWTDRYGIGPWALRTYDEAKIDASVDGVPTPFGMRVALTQLTPAVRIEIIQPLDDRSPYAASLERHGGVDHVHHMRMDVADYGTAQARLETLGHPKILDAEIVQGTEPGEVSRAIYFDTSADIGFVAEIADVPGRKLLEPEEIRG